MVVCVHSVVTEIDAEAVVIVDRVSKDRNVHRLSAARRGVCYHSFPAIESNDIARAGQRPTDRVHVGTGKQNAVQQITSRCCAVSRSADEVTLNCIERAIAEENSVPTVTGDHVPLAGICAADNHARSVVSKTKVDTIICVADRCYTVGTDADVIALDEVVGIAAADANTAAVTGVEVIISTQTSTDDIALAGIWAADAVIQSSADCHACGVTECDVPASVHADVIAKDLNVRRKRTSVTPAATNVDSDAHPKIIVESRIAADDIALRGQRTADPMAIA